MSLLNDQPRLLIIAGEPSGDALAAELVRALQLRTGPAMQPRFLGAGGPKMAAAGVELAVDMTAHSVVGLIEVLKKYRDFQKIFNQLLLLAEKEKPDAVILVDFSGFNRRFAAALRKRCRAAPQAGGSAWNPKIIYYVSPQVWASRPGRATAMARDIDLLLCLFPFEKEWYAKRVPGLQVEFIGHPLVDRFQGVAPLPPDPTQPPLVVLLPGSRTGELKRHLPVMLPAARAMAQKQALRFQLVVPTESLAELVRTFQPETIPGLELVVGGLAQALARAQLAIASTGTVTMECAYFGLPTVAIYKTSWSTYQIGKRIIQVNFLAMPNLLAGSAVFPELIQNNATSQAITREGLDLLNNSHRRSVIQSALSQVIASLNGSGANQRAAEAVLKLLRTC